MAQLGFRNSCVGNTDNVDDSALNPVGTTSFDADGNEYVYGLGVASVVAGSWVTFGGPLVGSAVALLTETSTGRVGIAMAAIVADKYGWFQIKGWNSIALAGSNGTIVSGGGALASEVASGGTGRVVLGTGDSFGVTQASFIYGAFSYSGQPDSDSAAAGTPGADLITVYLNYPYLAPLAASV
jgi:hypothetical protein